MGALKTLVPDFTYILDDLALLSDETLARRSDSPFLQLVLWSLRSRGHVEPNQQAALQAVRAQIQSEHLPP